MNGLDDFKDSGQAGGLFLGRQEEMREIASFIQGNQSVSIIGPRGIGKTSLMLQLMRDETAADLGIRESLLAYFDSEIFCTCRQEEILAGLCAGIADSLHDKGVAPEQALTACVATPSWMGFESAVRKINHRGLRIVLLVDAFEQISSNTHVDVRFYNGLRSLAGRLKLSLITSSECPLVELTCFQSSREVLSSPFFNIFSQLFLGLLSEDEARLSIRKTMEAAGKAINTQLENDIYQLVGGHPHALKVACLYADEWPDDPNKIELKTRQDLEGFFHRSWDSLSRYEQDMLLHLPEMSRQHAEKPEIRGVLRDLTRKCVVVKAGGLYEYPSKLWEAFVKTQ